MKIIVCVKASSGEIGPFDECALETALRIDNADITLLSMGPSGASSVLKRLSRLGPIRSILLTDNAFAGADTLATSYTLSCAVRKLGGYDLIICGRQSVDGDTAQVGPCLAKMLGIDVITNVMKLTHIDVKRRTIDCETRLGTETAGLPALITVERINTLRFPSIRSKPTDVVKWNSEDIGADTSRCGVKGSPTRVLKTFESVSGKRKCTYIEPEELSSLLAKLRSEVTVMSVAPSQTGDKLKVPVWAVGSKAAEAASHLSDDIILIEEDDPEKIAALALEKKPEVIIWDSDLSSRRKAPLVAAILNTGLCADCTSLTVENGKLCMYRPTYGGSLIAKIECRTFPQMATVRTTAEFNDEVIVAGGRGVLPHVELLKGLASMLGAGIGASRGLVDSGLMPYETQIGLTGKSVSPEIYIACGISGSVQHTCAVERSGVIIAINSDKKARIFEHADYGVIADFRQTAALLTDPLKG